MAQNINIKIPLQSEDNSFFDGNVDTFSALNENIKHILLTRRYERPLSSVGLSTSVLNDVLFEPINEKQMENKLYKEISNQLDRYIVDSNGRPRVNIEAIKIYTKEKNPELVGAYNSILLKLVYSINDFDNGEENINESVSIEISNIQ